MKTRNGLSSGLQVTVVGCWVTAACFASGAHADPPAKAPQTVVSTPSPDDDDCMLEIYAYLKVVSLAHELGSGADLLAVALEDLHRKLHDCLTHRGAGDAYDDSEAQLHEIRLRTH